MRGYIYNDDLNNTDEAMYIYNDDLNNTDEAIYI